MAATLQNTPPAGTSWAPTALSRCTSAAACSCGRTARRRIEKSRNSQRPQLVITLQGGGSRRQLDQLSIFAQRAIERAAGDFAVRLLHRIPRRRSDLEQRFNRCKIRLWICCDPQIEV